MRLDIFCSIIDNYGDIGVCWRLCQQLTLEHGIKMRLCVDDLGAAKKIIPKLDIARKTQIISGVKICHWLEPFGRAKPADVVIEAFGCELPQNYLSAMVKTKPIWLNLEYLSAENWVIEAHLKKSPHPKLPLTKYFFFPGFDARTGGLIREKNLIQNRDAFQQSKSAQLAFWKKLGVTPVASLKISLFCYPHAPLANLVNAILEDGRPTTLFVPDSSALPLAQHFGVKMLKVGEKYTKSNLTLCVLPFLSQVDYDHLLWACDINFVRGEDSWVRALWAAKPFIWQPYQQSENTHVSKLQAFLDFYAANLADDVREALLLTHKNWCNENFSNENWPSYLDALSNLAEHATRLSNRLANEPDLAAKLVIFCENFSK